MAYWQQARGAPHLLCHKLSLAFTTDLEKSVAGHVLHSRVPLVHELEQLVDDRLQELPVRPQEPGVLAHDVPAEKG